MTRLFVGNLSFEALESDLYAAFTQCGKVSRTDISVDPRSHKPRGHAFVEMPDPDEARSAISQLDGLPIAGMPIVVRSVLF